MRFRLTVVVDADEQQAVGIVGQLGGILATLDLIDGRIGILVELQFQNDGWRIDILARNEHQISEALARGQLTVDDVVVAGIVEGDAQHTGQ